MLDGQQQIKLMRQRESLSTKDSTNIRRGKDTGQEEVTLETDLGATTSVTQSYKLHVDPNTRLIIYQLEVIRFLDQISVIACFETHTQ